MGAGSKVNRGVKSNGFSMSAASADKARQQAIEEKAAAKRAAFRWMDKELANEGVVFFDQDILDHDAEYGIVVKAWIVSRLNNPSLAKHETEHGITVCVSSARGIA